MIDFSHIQIVAFPWQHRQMVTSFKGEIYFGSIPTLILFLVLLDVDQTTSFYSAFENFPPMSAILIPHQARLKRVPVKNKSIQLFFKFELFIASVKIQWEQFRLTIPHDN